MQDKTNTIFFDYNATASLRPEAKEAMLEVMDLVGNASSIHSHGRQMRQKLEESRKTIADILEVSTVDEIIFNSGGTEGNNTILKTFEKLDATIFVSAIEHPCVLKACDHINIIPVDHNGVVDLNWLDCALSKCDSSKPILVSTMLVNNETGVIQPLQQLIKIAKKYNAYVHSDAIQALSRIPLTLDLYPVDYMTLSGHKIGGCTGFGVLYAKENAPYTPLLLGGDQEKAKRSGTSNTLGAVSFAAALTAAHKQDWSAVEAIRNTIEKEILEYCPDAVAWAKDAPRVSNTLSIYMPHISSMTQLMAFDVEKIAVSSGSACSSGKLAPSYVLSAMGIDAKMALETIRISMGPMTTQIDGSRFLKTWKSIYDRISKKSSSKITMSA